MPVFDMMEMVLVEKHRFAPGIRLWLCPRHHVHVSCNPDACVHVLLVVNKPAYELGGEQVSRRSCARRALSWSLGAARRVC
jgi:hypothetical protein